MSCCLQQRRRASHILQVFTLKPRRSLYHLEALLLAPTHCRVPTASSMHTSAALNLSCSLLQYHINVYVYVDIYCLRYQAPSCLETLQSGHSPHLASPGTSTAAASAFRAPCQSHGSNFPTDYPTVTAATQKHPGEKQLLCPDVGRLLREQASRRQESGTPGCPGWGQ